MSRELFENPLAEVARHVGEEAQRSKVAVIFDLDSTLFSVSPRTQHILREFGHHPDMQSKFSSETEMLRRVEVLPTDWGIRSVLEREKIGSTMEFFMAVRDFWRSHFFASHFLDRDDIYPSANEYVRHLHSLGAEILYLTGRNEGSMKTGTISTLHKWGFPLFPETQLFMKPSDVLTDEGYKAQVLHQLANNYDHIWFFENEPLIIEQVRALVPKVRIIFVNSVHSGRAVAPQDLPTIGMNYTGNWRR